MKRKKTKLEKERGIIERKKTVGSDFSEDTGAPALSLHELRHTYGTMLYHYHTPLDAIAKIMGHSSLEITRKIYVHDTVDDLKARVIFPSK